MVNTCFSPGPLSFSAKLIEIQETERRHLARELHDEIGQLLTGLRLMLRPDGTLAPDAMKTRLDQAQQMVDEILARVRRVSTDLRPADLDQFGLLPALLGLFERFTTTTGLLVKFRHTGIEKRFAPAIETTAYRIAQEALTNAARHSGVAEVVVRIWADDDLLSLQIEDSGTGFSPAVVLHSSRSNGLAGMRERASLVGGSIAFESAPGAGTRIHAELPLAASAV